MKLHPLFKATTVGLVATGILMQPLHVRAESPTNSKTGIAAKSPTKPTSAILDVQLARDGALTGEVFNVKKEPVKNATISVRQGRKEVAQVRSGEDGSFTVKGIKPGVYHVVAGSGQGLYRVWSNDSAPPKSMASIKVVSDLSVIRGQSPNDNPTGEGRILYDQNGTAYGQVRVIDEGGLIPVGTGGPVGVAGGGSFLSGVGVFDVLTVGVGVAAITVGAIAIDKANDAKDQVDRLSASP